MSSIFCFSSVLLDLELRFGICWRYLRDDAFTCFGSKARRFQRNSAALPLLGVCLHSRIRERPQDAPGLQWETWLFWYFEFEINLFLWPLHSLEDPGGPGIELEVPGEDCLFGTILSLYSFLYIFANGPKFRVAWWHFVISSLMFTPHNPVPKQPLKEAQPSP